MRTLFPLLLAATLLTGCTGLAWFRGAPDESQDIGRHVLAIVENAGGSPLDAVITLLQGGTVVDGVTFRVAPGATEQRAIPYPAEASYMLRLDYTVDGTGRASAGSNDVELDAATCPGSSVVTYRVEAAPEGVASSAQSECRTG